MKTIFKSILTLGLVVGLGVAANAQTTVSATRPAQATATVLTNIALVKDSDIAFGNVQTGNIPVLNDLIRTAHTTVGATATLGKFTVTGTPTASVLVTFGTTVTMTAGTNQLLFTPTVSRTDITADTDGATAILTSGTYTISTGAAAGSVAGTDHFFVGGTLSASTGINDPIPATASGLYTGTFTLTVAYN